MPACEYVSMRAREGVRLASLSSLSSLCPLTMGTPCCGMGTPCCCMGTPCCCMEQEVAHARIMHLGALAASACMFIRKYIYTYTYVCICIYVYQLYTHIPMYVYAYTYTWRFWSNITTLVQHWNMVIWHALCNPLHISKTYRERDLRTYSGAGTSLETWGWWARKTGP